MIFKNTAVRDRTIAFYDKHAAWYSENTVNVDMSKPRDKFLSYLQPGAHILDFGCGSGRDTKAFLEKGYQIDATDGSEEMCKLASSYTGISVRHMLFNDLSAVLKYDGIWACCSILHLELRDLKDAMIKMCCALKPDGVIYVNFKHGLFSGIEDGRCFTNMTEEALLAFVDDIGSLQVEEMWLSQDSMPGRENVKWLNAILKMEE